MIFLLFVVHRPSNECVSLACRGGERWQPINQASVWIHDLLKYAKSVLSILIMAAQFACLMYLEYVPDD